MASERIKKPKMITLINEGPQIDTRTRSQRYADWVCEFCGSWEFVTSFSIIILFWVLVNIIGYLNHWDPYPFILLNLFLTIISTMQSPLIMMSQNRQTERDREAIQGLHEKLDNIIRLEKQL